MQCACTWRKSLAESQLCKLWAALMQGCKGSMAHIYVLLEGLLQVCANVLQDPARTQAVLLVASSGPRADFNGKRRA